MFHFHPIHKKCKKFGQKLAFTYPIAVLKSGLKNNWMNKLDRVNRPLISFAIEYKISWTLKSNNDMVFEQSFQHNSIFANNE